MYTWAEIEKGVVRCIFSPPDDGSWTPPTSWDKNIEYVEITHLDPMPEKGWVYEDGEFEDLTIPADKSPAPEPTHPPIEELDNPTLDDLKRQAKTQINSVAAGLCIKHTRIGNLGHIHLLKAEQAQAFKDAGYPNDNLDDYPWIQQESIGLNKSAKKVADTILAKRDEWTKIIGPAIERERLKGRQKVKAAKSEKGIATARDAAIKALQDI